jgi:GT2 family glycosyltransferase
MERGLKTYAVVVTYNGMEWIQQCLDSLVNSSLDLNIVIIDNKSTDGTVKYINEQYPKCLLIESEENLGFGRANNVGISKALQDDADFVFLLNQDAWVESTTIEDLIKVQQNNLGFDIISPIHMNGEGTKLDYLFSTFIEPKRCPNLYSDMYCSSLKNELYPAEFVNAAAWLLTKKCIQTVGGFSPIFYHYGEDDNYCLRAKYHNIKIGVYPFAKIYHDKVYGDTKFENQDQILARQKIVFYSDPHTNANLSNDIYINKMSSIKALVKFNFEQSKLFSKKHKELKTLRDNINDYVEQSKKQGANFL